MDKMEGNMDCGTMKFIGFLIFMACAVLVITGIVSFAGYRIYSYNKENATPAVTTETVSYNNIDDNEKLLDINYDPVPVATIDDDGPMSPGIPIVGDEKNPAEEWEGPIDK